MHFAACVAKDEGCLGTQIWSLFVIPTGSTSDEKLVKLNNAKDVRVSAIMKRLLLILQVEEVKKIK